MYKITYQKRNGEVFDRIRASLPGKIGDITSMNWLIKDIQYQFNDKYYSFEDYKLITRKYYKILHIKRNINLFLKRYSTLMALIILVPFLILK